MKKLISILLLATMMLYSVGFFIAYRYNIKLVKREMRSAIASRQYEPEQLFTIEIPLKNNEPTAPGFEKVDKHEFRYNGDMYDIVSTRWEKDTVVYSCINDKEETHLVAVFANEVQRQTDHPVAGKKAVTLAKFSFSGYTVSESLILPDLELVTISSATSFCPNKLSVAFLNIPSPPPWLV